MRSNYTLQINRELQKIIVILENCLTTFLFENRVCKIHEYKYFNISVSALFLALVGVSFEAVLA